jgi:hypothetical protein
MSGIQILLITCVLFLGVYFLVRLRNRVFDIILLFLIVLAAIGLILFPEFTQKVADILGVGRGVDLVFYLCIILFWFVLLKLYTKIRQLDNLLTELIRKQSLQEEKKEKS